MIVPIAHVSTIYLLLKESHFSLPQRSTYNHLEPLGIETSAVESLTSYFSRLAISHSISVGTLYEFEIIPRLNKPYLVSPQHLGPASTLMGSFRNQIKNINGVGKIAREWTELLEKMTLRRDLKCLTFLPWSEVLTHLKLLKPAQAWCPVCYEEMQHNTVYQPLIWSVDLVKICLRHRVCLVDRCSKCERQFPALARRAKPGFCPRCDNWLGAIADEYGADRFFKVSELEWQEFVCDNVGELISVTPTLSCTSSKDCIAKWLQICADRVTQGKMQRLSALLGIHNLTVHEWRQGRIKPVLFNLLRICYCLDLRLVDLLAGIGIESKNLFKAKQFPQELEPVKRSRRNKAFNFSKVEKQLVKYSKTSPPISLAKVSVEIGYDRSTLSKWWPDLCRKISQRYKDFLQAKHKKHRGEREEEVQRACLALYKQNIYLTARSVAEFLCKPSYLGRRDVAAIIKATRKQLGQTSK